MGTASCITIESEGEIVFRAVLNHDGDIRIAPKAVGDYVLEFLRDQTKYHDLKLKAYLLKPV